MAAPKKNDSPKKVSPKRTTRRKPPISKEIEAPLSLEEIEQFQEMLLAKRREIVGDVGFMNLGALRKGHDGSGDLSSMPIHMADIGTDNYEQEFTLDLIASDRKILTDIDRALAKMAEGTYGLCESTGQFIGRPRLNAKPWARYTVEHMNKIEKGLVKPPSGNDDFLRDSQDEEDEEAVEVND